MTEELIRIEGKVEIDKSELDRMPAEAERVSSQLERTPAKIRAEMDTRPALVGARSIHEAVRDIDKTVITPRMNIGPASAELAKLRTEAAALAPSMRAMSDADLKRVSAQGMTAGIAGGATARTGGVAMAFGSGSAISGLAAGFGALAAGMAAKSMWDMAMDAQAQARLEAFTKRVYGSAGGTEFAAAAERMQESTGFQSSDVLRAVLAGQELTRTYSFQTSQIKQLVRASADLAATSPHAEVQTVSGAMERLSAALRGDNNAAALLGIVLDDTHMKTVALGGAMRNTWEGMSEAEQAQARYTEALKQMSGVMGAAESDEGLDSQLRKVKGELAEIGVELGETLLPALTGLLAAINDFLDAIPWDKVKEFGAGAVGGGVPWGMSLQALDLVKKLQSDAEKQSLQFTAQQLVLGRQEVRDPYGNVLIGPEAVTGVPKVGVPNMTPWPTIIGETRIVLQNESGVPLRVQDARSYAPSNA